MFHGFQRPGTKSIDPASGSIGSRKDSIDLDDYQSISDGESDDDNDPMLKILIENIIDDSDSSEPDDEDSHK